MFLTLQAFYNLVGFLRHLAVHILPLFVIQVDVLGCRQRVSKVAFYEQIDGFLSVLHASRRIDARPYLEGDVAHREFAPVQSADVDDGFEPDAGVYVQLLQSVEGKDAVLVGHGDEVGSDADGTEVE